MKRLHTMRTLHVLLLAAVVALCMLPATAFAEHLSGRGGWTVTFNTDEKLVDNYSASQFADDISGLQPGDDITFVVTLQHQHPTSADWYMNNQVLKSLETSVAQGSAYGYLLTYSGPSGGKTLYDSSKVGGDNTSGLVSATGALQDFFFLDNLSQGQTATVQLVVSLDGETEGNAYFDTLAQLKMQFAVELDQTKPGTPTNRTAVKTGDETNLFPFYVAMAASGAALMALLLFGVRRRKREESEGFEGGAR